MVKNLYIIGKDISLHLFKELSELARKYSNRFDAYYKSKGESAISCDFENHNKKKEFEKEYNNIKNNM